MTTCPPHTVCLNILIHHRFQCCNRLWSLCQIIHLWSPLTIAQLLDQQYFCEKLHIPTCIYSYAIYAATTSICYQRKTNYQWMSKGKPFCFKLYPHSEMYTMRIPKKIIVLPNKRHMRQVIRLINLIISVHFSFW